MTTKCTQHGGSLIMSREGDGYERGKSGTMGNLTKLKYQGNICLFLSEQEISSYSAVSIFKDFTCFTFIFICFLDNLTVPVLFADYLAI